MHVGYLSGAVGYLPDTCRLPVGYVCRTGSEVCRESVGRCRGLVGRQDPARLSEKKGTLVDTQHSQGVPVSTWAKLGFN